ncbi:unnamed protein product [Thlaspi arvense]|uniref:Legume lectin domain-containing protein n=1 Tax=Thlaspi arvense TaxID=13288 RepID=A0AAU9RIY2_THLAR|nr:unnamed protein product [Thlaspi arvense]
MMTFYFLHTIHPSSALGFNLINIGPQDQNVHVKTYADAYISLQGIQVTNDERGSNLQQRAGKAVYTHLLHLWDKASGNLTNFTTYFVFVIDSTSSSFFADGLAFFLAPEGANLTVGGAMGLPIDPDPRNITATSSFFAVEFDTFQNSWDPQDINPVTHGGININSLTSNATAVWYNDIPHGIENEAWINYDSGSKNLTVIFTGSRNNTRVEGSLHLLVDLSYLPEWVEFGFSASTGTGFEKNNVKSWQFNSSLQIDENPGSPPPSLPGKKRRKKNKWALAVGLTGGLCSSVGVIGFGLWKKRRGKEELYGRRKVLEAVDLRLCEQFEEQEMEQLMVVGLWCAHPDHNLRPSIRQAIQVLNFEAPLPNCQ